MHFFYFVLPRVCLFCPVSVFVPVRFFCLGAARAAPVCTVEHFVWFSQHQPFVKKQVGVSAQHVQGHVVTIRECARDLDISQGCVRLGSRG